MSGDGRARAAEAFRARRLAGTGRPEYRLVDGFVRDVEKVVNELAADGWRLLGPVNGSSGTRYAVGTLVREVLP